MIKVSVIVPVYNAVKYIDRFMECLLGQTLDEMEIIAINDKSTDDTGMMLDAWQEKYPSKIKVIHSEKNGGPGGARNLGLLHATGEYVGFMDCDDVVDEDLFKKLYGSAKEKDCDIVDCGYYDERNERAVLTFTDDVIGELDDEKRSNIIRASGYSFAKIFRKTMFNDETLRFRTNVIYEDLDFLIAMTLAAKKVGNVKEVLYVYKNNEQSASKEKNEQKKFDDMMGAFMAIDSMKYQDGVKEAMEYAMINCAACAISFCLFNQDNPYFKLIDNVQYLRAILKEKHLDWNNNSYVKQYMPQENLGVLKWFEKIM